MNKQRILLALPVLALTLLSARERGDAVSFHPEAGLALQKTIDHTFTQTLSDITVLMNGEEQEVPEIPEVVIKNSERAVLVDTYRKVSDERPTHLLRKFVELTGTKFETNPEGETEEDKSSELEGVVVSFKWDEDEGEFTPSVEEGEADGALLDELEADIDFLGLLPDGDVEEGDTWEVDIATFLLVFSPGGDLGIETEEGQSDEDREISTQIDDNMEGDLEAEYAGTRDEDGVRVAVIKLTGTTTSTAELSRTAEMGEIKRTLDIEMELEGELLWDLKAGHAAAFELKADVSVTMLEEQSLELGDQSLEIEQTIEFEGEFELEIAIQVADE